MPSQDFEWKYEAKEKIRQLKKNKKSGIRLEPIIKSTSGAFMGRVRKDKIVEQVRPFHEKRVVGYSVSWRG